LSGHEGCGEVVEIGDSITKVKVGDWVILGWIKASGKDVKGAIYKCNGVKINSGPVTTFSNYSIVSEKTTIAMLETIGLKDRMNHFPNEISGGERQRVAVLRAMVNNPSLILADEPTGNLDRENSQKMLKLMAELKVKYQQSFIIATHDQSILDIADRILYLKDGKIKKEV
jgi:predicted ABC-type transport system involved in lysophospholipase L1 biosynthesis ATPase subunit